MRLIMFQIPRVNQLHKLVKRANHQGVEEALRENDKKNEKE
jgi:hypothetical protein